MIKVVDIVDDVVDRMGELSLITREASTEMVFTDIDRATDLPFPRPDSPYWFKIHSASQSYGVWLYFGGYAEPSDISDCDVKIQVDNAYSVVGMDLESTGVQQATAIADTLNADATFTGFDPITRDGATLTFTATSSGGSATKDATWSELTITESSQSPIVRVGTTNNYTVTVTKWNDLIVNNHRITFTDGGDTVHGVISEANETAKTFVANLDSDVGDGTGVTDISIYFNYLHGHAVDIVKVLQGMTRSKDTKGLKFPLVALMQDIEEGVDVDGYQSTASVNVILCTDTKPEYEARQRYAETFTPLLYPMYEEFVKCLRLSPYVYAISPSYTKIDRLYWGREGLYGNTGNVFNDFIDAIELNNIELKILQNC